MFAKHFLGFGVGWKDHGSFFLLRHGYKNQDANL